MGRGRNALHWRPRPFTLNFLSTFEDKFCQAHRCKAEDFERRLFWRCLHRHALVVAPLFLLFNREYFSLDRELIREVRKAEKMNEVWEEIREYFVSPKYQGWMRKRANVRISARRLINLAREHLPSTGSPPPAYPPPERSRDGLPYSMQDGAPY